MRAPTSTVLVAEVGEAPDVGQVDSEADDGEQEVDLLAPRLAIRVCQLVQLRLLHALRRHRRCRRDVTRTRVVGAGGVKDLLFCDSVNNKICTCNGVSSFF